jgi:N6-L-threonylcarbamoyladenine synthase
MLHQKNYDFSYSGLKTAVLYYVRDSFSNLRSSASAKASADRQNKLSLKLKADVAASFQEAALEVLVAKAKRAVEEYGARSILLSGGVAANRPLREKLGKLSKKLGIRFLVAEFKHNTDNAVMIAVAAYINFLKKKKYPLVANGALNIR